MSGLQVERLTAGYSVAAIVNDVTLELEPGRILALVGPNGAGKSTVLKALCGLLRNVTGRVLVDGQDVSGWPPHKIARRGMAYVPQVSNVFPSLTVTENLEIGGYVLRRDVKAGMERVFGIFPDLGKAAKQRARNLSGGQRNMLAMARALMLSPKVVLLDEPTAGLSPLYVGTVWTQVRRVAESGAAVLVVEQNVDLALRHAESVCVLVAGRTRLQGTPAEVRKHDLSALFLGGAAPVNEGALGVTAATAGMPPAQPEEGPLGEGGTGNSDLSGSQTHWR